jgi:hypothetical protein
MALKGKSARLTVLSLWAVVSVMNIGKAVHIDDGGTLEIAQHIVSDPLHPMSGEMFWGDTHSEPIHHTNQPHLTYYMYAAVMALFGPSELLLHCVIAAFSLLAILFFYQLAESTGTAYAPALTTMFCMSPVFLVSQNLMTDVPLIALWLLFFRLILCDQTTATRLSLAALTVGIACLVKYTALVLLPLLFITIVLRRRYQLLWVLGIPVIVLVGWSIFNYLDYGGIHILSRNAAPWDKGPIADRVISWIICCGAVMPFSIVFVPYLWSRPRGRKLLLAATLCTVLISSQKFMGFLLESNAETVLRVVFFGNGVLLLCGTMYWLIGKVSADRFDNSSRQVQDVWILGLSMGGSIAFVLLFADFMAVRRLLPVLPVVLLLMAKGPLPKVAAGWRHAGLAVTVLLGLALGASDWLYADVYRKQAERFTARYVDDSRTVWFAGHWGWQWYARRGGMQQYDQTTSKLALHDVLIVPQNVDRQRIAGLHRLANVDTVKIAGGPSTYFRTMRNERGLYGSNIYALPWTLTAEPLETFEIYAADHESDGT